MSSTNLKSHDFQPHASPHRERERPKLDLQPRSVDAAHVHDSVPTGRSSSKPSPFGEAKPREVVLQSKGIDPKLVEKRVEMKASVPKLTAEQNHQVESLRRELTEFEEKLREANENELPEEELRVAVEKKRTELNQLMKQFQEMAMEDGEERDRQSSTSGLGGRKFERPSERRRRLEQQRLQQDHHHDPRNDYHSERVDYGSHRHGGRGRGRFYENDYERDGGRGSHGGHKGSHSKSGYGTNYNRNFDS